MLYNRSWEFNHLITKSLYSLTTLIQFLYLPLATINVFCFHNLLLLILYISEIIQFLSFSDLFSIMPSNFIYFVANGKISFFFGWVIFYCVYAYTMCIFIYVVYGYGYIEIYCFFSHSSVMDTQIISVSWLLSITLQWTWGAGAPGWLRWGNICLWLASWSQGSGMEPCIRLPAQQGACFSLSLCCSPYLCSLSLSLSLSNK